MRKTLKIPRVPLLPKKCDLCQDPIGLYKPWYSILVDPHFTKVRSENDVSVLCPECFRAYENFITERKLKTLHAREIHESMHPEK